MTQHPEIQGSLKKETFAITDQSYKHFNVEATVLNDSFSWSTFFEESDSKYRLEGSVCNFYQETAKDYIKKIEGSKVIFIVRDPIDRFVSTYNYYGGSGIFLNPGTSLEDYFQMVQGKETPLEAMNFALEHGCYSNFIKEWTDLLGAENILVLSMKEVVYKPDVAAKKLGDFLNLDAQLFPNQMSVKNQSTVIKNKNLHLFIRNLLKGKGLGKTKLAQFYMKLNKTKPKKSSLDSKLKNILLDYYKKEYDELKHLF
jgi:hypothetical protein